MVDEPDNGNTVRDRLGECLQGLARRIGERGPHEKVFWRIPRNREFRGEDEHCAGIRCATHSRTNTLNVSIEVTHDRVDLRTCDAHEPPSVRAEDI